MPWLMTDIGIRWSRATLAHECRATYIVSDTSIEASCAMRLSALFTRAITIR